jgi:ribosomal protein S12 methylthiotransferase accessory factor
MGITRIANVTGLDSIGVPVVMVCRPNSRSIAVSQGKGLDLAAAKASGLMESIETYHAETITLPLRYCSHEDLRYSHAVVDVGRLPAVSTSVFHPNLRILWCEGRDLLNDKSTFVPYELVHTDYTWPQHAGSGCFPATSNGLASGNHLQEAISHGICEVVERDAMSLSGVRDAGWRASRALDLESVDDPACNEVIGKFRRGGLEVALWETTTDVGIPCFSCVVFTREDDPLRPLPPAAGSGCHPARGIALLRALTEAAQSRLTQISGARDDVGRHTYARHRYAGTLDELRRGLASPRPRRFLAAPNFESDTVDKDVAWELARLRDAGVTQVVAVDLTKDEFGIPVVRVVIPGLEGLRDVPGYVPGPRAIAASLAAG